MSLSQFKACANPKHNILQYEHGPSRSAAMSNLLRPDHLVGTLSACYYDPDWSTRSALIPASQVAFASEMGYSIWKWLLLLLCLGVALSCGGTFEYARRLNRRDGKNLQLM